MRIGLISDIHGNLVSFESVLADIDRAGVDRVVCLGDVAAIGPQPCEVVAKGVQTVGRIHESSLRSLQNYTCCQEADQQGWQGIIIL